MIIAYACAVPTPGAAATIYVVRFQPRGSDVLTELYLKCCMVARRLCQNDFFPVVIVAANLFLSDESIFGATIFLS